MGPDLLQGTRQAGVEGGTAPIHPPLTLELELTLRYWYRQMDIQLDSILSTTVSDLRVHRGLIFLQRSHIPKAQLAPGPHHNAHVSRKAVWPLWRGVPIRMGYVAAQTNGGTEWDLALCLSKEAPPQPTCHSYSPYHPQTFAASAWGSWPPRTAP